MSVVSLLVYGSLINKQELMNNDIKIINYTPVFVKGLKREFSQEPSWRKSTSENRAVLSVSLNKMFFINALLVDIESKYLKTIDERECGYNRIKIKKKNIKFKYNQEQHIRNDDIYIYTGKKEKYNSNILPNLEYLDICLDGARNWGEVFYSDFIDSTFVQNEALESFIKNT